MKAAALLLVLAAAAPAQSRRAASGTAKPATGQMQVVALPSKSPLVTFNLVFLAGSADDPSNKPGLAAFTGAMLAQGGTQKLAYNEIVDAMFPMATEVSFQVDKEMTSFSAVTHVDNLNAFYHLFRAMLLEPGWRAEGQGYLEHGDDGHEGRGDDCCCLHLVSATDEALEGAEVGRPAHAPHLA